MVGDYYLCKLPAEKQSSRYHTPTTKFYGIQLNGQDRVYRIIHQDFDHVVNAAANKHIQHQVPVRGIVPPRAALEQTRKFVHEPQLRLLLDQLLRHYQDLEPFSIEELRTGGLEEIVTL